MPFRLSAQLLAPACLAAFALVSCSEKSTISAERSTACAGVDENELSVKDAWVRSAPAGRPMSAAYLTICNGENSENRLVSVDAGDLATAELHETTTTEDGVSSMRPVEAFSVSPGDAFSLKPGGAHVMLIGLSRPIEDGDSISLKLGFANGETINVEATARSNADAADQHRH
ncbi:MAG: copper chaperone PCu(A)C [Pseudomonadota bacterium]